MALAALAVLALRVRRLPFPLLRPLVWLLMCAPVALLSAFWVPPARCFMPAALALAAVLACSPPVVVPQLELARHRTRVLLDKMLDRFIFRRPNFAAVSARGSGLSYKCDHMVVNVCFSRP